MADIDMTEVRKLLEQIAGIADELHGISDQDPVQRTQHRTAQRAKVSRRLTYAAHLCDLASLEVRNQFHRFKGENPPSIRS